MTTTSSTSWPLFFKGTLLLLFLYILGEAMAVKVSVTNRIQYLIMVIQGKATK